MDLKRRLEITGEIVGSVEDRFADAAKSNGRASGISEIGRTLAELMMMGNSWAWKLYFEHGLVAMPRLTIEASGTLGREASDVLRLMPLVGGYLIAGNESEGSEGNDSDGGDGGDSAGS